MTGTLVVAVVGDARCGKSSLVSALRERKPSPKFCMPEYEATLDTLRLNQLWLPNQWRGLAQAALKPEPREIELRDTVGSPQSGPLRELVYAGANAVLIAFDMTDRATLHRASGDGPGTGWAAEVRAVLGAGFAEIVLVGCKHDLWSRGLGGVGQGWEYDESLQRHVRTTDRPRPCTEAECWAVADQIGARCLVLSSGKEMLGVEELKDVLIEMAHNNLNEIPTPARRPDDRPAVWDGAMVSGRKVVTESMNHSEAGAVWAPYGDHINGVEDHITVWERRPGGPWWRNPPGEPLHRAERRFEDRMNNWRSETHWGERRFLTDRRTVYH